MSSKREGSHSPSRGEASSETDLVLMSRYFSFPFGSSNAAQCLTGKVNFMMADKILAEGDFKDQKIFGYFLMGQPTLVINDEARLSSGLSSVSY